MEDITYEKALHKAAALCSSGEKCEYDIREKLLSWGVDAAASEEVIQYLIREKFLDERRYASFFVKDKFRFNKWGKIKIAYALKQKRVAPSIIQEALDVIDEDEYLLMLKDILQSKLKSLTYKNEYDKQAKLFHFAQSRGFENGVIAGMLKGV